MLGGFQDVIPNENARQLAKKFPYLLSIEVAALLPLAILGQFWVILQSLTILLGWFALRDKTSYRTKLLLMYFTSTVFGCAFIAVDALTWLSFLFTGPTPSQRNAPDVTVVPDIQASGLVIFTIGFYLSLVTALLAFIANETWRLCKVLYVCTPSPVNQSTSLSTLLMNPTQYTNFGQNSQTSDFMLFQGEGRRLGDV